MLNGPTEHLSSIQDVSQPVLSSAILRMYIWCCWLVVSFVSQNHRMFRVGRDLCGSSSPTLLPKQGRLQQPAQDLVQVGLEYLQRRRLHNLPGQPVPVLRFLVVPWPRTPDLQTGFTKYAQTSSYIARFFHVLLFGLYVCCNCALFCTL